MCAIANRMHAAIPDPSLGTAKETTRRNPARVEFVTRPLFIPQGTRSSMHGYIQQD